MFHFLWRLRRLRVRREVNLGENGLFKRALTGQGSHLLNTEVNLAVGTQAIGAVKEREAPEILSIEGVWDGNAKCFETSSASREVGPGAW